eukprot:14483930-Alexandrium_andersonii.AAC.1
MQVSPGVSPAGPSASSLGGGGRGGQKNAFWSVSHDWLDKHAASIVGERDARFFIQQHRESS